MAGIPDDQRPSYIRRQLVARCSEYSALKQVHVLLITWNVNGTGPPADPSVLSSLFDCGCIPKLIVVGLQEVIRPDQSVSPWTSEGVAEQMARSWVQSMSLAIDLALRRPYTLLDTCRLSGILLAIYRLGDGTEKSDMMVRRFGKGTAPCGLMGVMGNKGGVGVRVRVADSLLTFVNCHLAASVESLERRNQDYREIRRRLLLPHFAESVHSEDSDGGGEESSAAQRTVRVLREDLLLQRGVRLDDCDELIWMGDLNYRLTQSRPAILKGLPDKDHHFAQFVSQYDQLLQQIANQQAFHGFQEAPITFPPTYKYDPGSDTFDSSAKARSPAYCDRILFRTAPPSNIAAPLSYDSISELKQSDHRPVRAVFQIPVNHIQPHVFDAVYASVLQQLDAWENAQIPVTELHFPAGSTVIDFGRIRFGRPYAQTIRLQNAGATAADYCVLPESVKPWLTFSPDRGMLPPGGVADIGVGVFVDGRSGAAQLNAHTDRVSGTVAVLHVRGGRDHFVAIEGTFVSTKFAVPLAIEHDSKGSGGDGVIAMAPEPLRRLAEFIVLRDGLNCPQLLLVSGNPATVSRIIECIDDGLDFGGFVAGEEGMRSVGECVLMWLDALPEPLIPPAFTLRHVLGGSLDSGCTKHLPEPSWIVFDYIVSMFRLVPAVDGRAAEREYLAFVLGEAMMRTREFVRPRADRITDQRIVGFMRQFIG